MRKYLRVVPRPHDPKLDFTQEFEYRQMARSPEYLLALLGMAISQAIALPHSKTALKHFLALQKAIEYQVGFKFIEIVEDEDGSNVSLAELMRRRVKILKDKGLTLGDAIKLLDGSEAEITDAWNRPPQ